MLNIPIQSQKLLVDQSSLKKLESGEYLVDETNENFKYIKEKFFKYESFEKAKLLNVGTGLFGCIADVISNYVGNPTLDTGDLLDDFVKDFVTLGFFTIGLSRVEGKMMFEYIPAKNYWNDNGVHKVGRIFESGDQKKYYMFVQEFAVGFTYNKLYELNGYSMTGGREVSLDTIRQTNGMSEVIDTGLQYPALIVRQDNSTSMAQRVKSIIYAMDRQMVMNHLQFMQNVESFILMKNINWPAKIIEQYEKGVRIDFSTLGRVVQGDDDSSIEFINNVNSLIDKSMEDIKEGIRKISAITSIPEEFLGGESKDGAIGYGSRSLKHGSFIKKIQGIRDIIDGVINILVEENNESAYDRPDIIAKTDTELADEISKAREFLLISHLKAIQMYNGYTDEEALNEYNKIKEEEAGNTPEKTILDPNNKGQGK